MKYKHIDWYRASAMFIQKLYGLYTVLNLKNVPVLTNVWSLLKLELIIQITVIGQLLNEKSVVRIS